MSASPVPLRPPALPLTFPPAPSLLPLQFGKTPLHTAVEYGHAPVVVLLLATPGVDPFASCVRARSGGSGACLFVIHRFHLLQGGKTPLDLALSAGGVAIAALLRADPRVAADEAALTLHNAAARGRDDAVRRLLAAGAPVNGADEVRDLRGLLRTTLLHMWLCRLP